MSFRFVHTADVHLNSPLRTLALREPALADLIGGATRRAFVSIVDLCLAEKVDALLIAGDLYDGDQTSMKTARFLADQLRRLHEAEIPTFIIRGNHDAESRITRELTLPESVKVFSGRADAVTIGAGASRRRDPRRQLRPEARAREPAAEVPRAGAGAVNIGMLHTSLGGSPAHDRYAPCTCADLHGTGFAYWALGHVHQRSVESGPGDDRHAGQSAGTRHQRGGAPSRRRWSRSTTAAEFRSRSGRPASPNSGGSASISPAPKIGARR